MNEKQFDVAILGGGPGGYPAAIACAQGGLNVAIIEAQDLGGTCLNRGCIPTKALIASADVLRSIRKASNFGIACPSISFDFNTMKVRKDTVVTQIRKSLEGLIQSHQIKVFRGFGQFASDQEIKISGQEKTLIRAKHIIIATGSEPRSISTFPFDGTHIHSSTTILDLTQLPQRILIVGGGVIGCEFASLYNELGSVVTILETMPRILPLECASVSHYLSQSFEKRGIHIRAGVSAQQIKKTPTGIQAHLQDGSLLEADIALIAIGRSFNSEQIQLDKAGVAVDPKGFILVDEQMQTSHQNIYAVGDVTGKSMYAHAATHQGIVAAHNILGRYTKMDYNAIPGVIFTHPEIGTVGMSLEQAQSKGYKAQIGKFPFQALGKAHAASQTEGFAQIVIDTSTGQILGAQVIGHDAAHLIAEMTTAIANELTVECITETVHAHPTLTEAWHEAALIATGNPLHFPPSLKK